MSKKMSQQWRRREGYGGPESFPEDGLADYSVGETDALTGQEYSLFLSDGRVRVAQDCGLLNAEAWGAYTLTATGAQIGIYPTLHQGNLIEEIDTSAHPRQMGTAVTTLSAIWLSGRTMSLSKTSSTEERVCAWSTLSARL